MIIHSTKAVNIQMENFMEHFLENELDEILIGLKTIKNSENNNMTKKDIIIYNKLYQHIKNWTSTYTHNRKIDIILTDNKGQVYLNTSLDNSFNNLQNAISGKVQIDTLDSMNLYNKLKNRDLALDVNNNTAYYGYKFGYGNEFANTDAVIIIKMNNIK